MNNVIVITLSILSFITVINALQQNDEHFTRKRSGVDQNFQFKRSLFSDRNAYRKRRAKSNGEDRVKLPKSEGIPINTRAGDALNESTESCIAGLCENVPDYPEKEISKLLEKYNSNQLQRLLALDEIPDPVVGTRAGEGEDELKDICDSAKMTRISARSGYTSNGELVTIVNQRVEGQEQFFNTEICRFPNASCDYPGMLPAGFRCYCYQATAFRNVAVYRNNDIVPDVPVRYSSCCKPIISLETLQLRNSFIPEKNARNKNVRYIKNKTPSVIRPN